MWISKRCLTCFWWAWRMNSSATWLCPNRLISVDFSSSRIVWKVLPKGSKSRHRSQKNPSSVQIQCKNAIDHSPSTNSKAGELCAQLGQTEVQHVATKHSALCEPKWSGWNHWVIVESSDYSIANYLQISETAEVVFGKTACQIGQSTWNSLQADKMITKEKEKKLLPRKR